MKPVLAAKSLPLKGITRTIKCIQIIAKTIGKKTIAILIILKIVLFARNNNL